MKITKRQLRRIVSEEISKAKSSRLNEMMEEPEWLSKPVAKLILDGELRNTINTLARQVLAQLEEHERQGMDVLDVEMYATDVSQAVFDTVFQTIEHLWS